MKNLLESRIIRKGVPVIVLLAAGAALSACSADDDPSQPRPSHLQPSAEATASVSKDKPHTNFQQAVSELNTDTQTVANRILDGMSVAVAPPVRRGEVTFYKGPRLHNAQGAHLNDFAPQSYIYYDSRSHYLDISFLQGWLNHENSVDVDYRVPNKVNAVDEKIAGGLPVTVADIQGLVDDSSVQVATVTTVNSNACLSEQVSFTKDINRANHYTVGYDMGGPELAIGLDSYDMGSNLYEIKLATVGLRAAQHALFSQLKLPDAL